MTVFTVISTSVNLLKLDIILIMHKEKLGQNVKMKQPVMIFPFHCSGQSSAAGFLPGEKFSSNPPIKE